MLPFVVGFLTPISDNIVADASGIARCLILAIEIEILDGSQY